MARYSRNRILPVIVTVIIVIVAVVVLVSLIRAIFFSGTTTQQDQTTDTSKQELLSTAATQKVRMTIRGPIVADEQFNSMQITITPAARALITYEGYLNTPIDTVSLSNNTKAYEEFVYALDKANLASGTQLQAERDDTRGICATGRVYEYEIIRGETTIKRLWTSTCKGSPGSLKASREQLTNLFTAQIPDVRNYTNKIDL